VTSILASLRDGRFLTRRRLEIYPFLLIGSFAVGIVFLIATAHGLSDYDGRPLGTDFSSFYSAGKLALSGGNPFDQQALYLAERARFGNATPYYAFSYPPIFLLLLAPLASLPYPAALIAWQVLTFALYLAAMAILCRRFCSGLGASNSLYLLLATAFPAVFINLTHGQNGFLTTGLLTLGLALLAEQPLLAGLCFGLLAQKPQLGLLLPFALAAGGRWKSFLAAAITVAALILISASLFGMDSWRAFLATAQFSRRAILDQDGVGYEKMVSVFAGLRLWHAPLILAYSLQALASLALVILTMRIWRGTASPRLKAAMLPLATLLATPFALDYDLMLLAPALALIGAEGRAHGFRPFELSLLTLLWALPLFGRSIAMVTHIPLAPLAILALLIMVKRRAESA
jgi:alpha-1,2-mannosyltransferase